jgi:DNA-binding transcriptional MerR regulator
VVQGRKVGLSIAEIRHLLETYEQRGEAAQNALAVSIFRTRVEALQAERARIEEAIETLDAAVARLSAAPRLTEAA